VNIRKNIKFVGLFDIYKLMKLLKTIEKLIKESEDAYNNALNMSISEKELDRLEKNYKDSLKLMKTYHQINKKKG
jgi:hypothetical protein